ncbi:penicillin-binding protein 2 [Candidatus Caldatribacterium sp.]|uniref:penicillin-binding protein 2 n=1 Tax=Candidatus Caldatribacterium sp. TaxID=2282143 RepID=UPI0029960D8C|nr:penicillin-binding protein 2 [Candidatus Caldatribacterium sp.]MDW8080692.1 penicillin-binding protein 2 [Candidatus Calescibacterium sp.]
MVWGEETGERVRQRIALLFWLGVGLFCVLSSRLWYLSVLRADWFRERSERNRVRVVFLQALRGNIYDRNGLCLAKDVPRFRLVLLAGSGKKEDVLRRVKDILGKNVTFSLRERGAGEIVLLEDVSLEDVIRIEENRGTLPGVLIETYPVRSYEFGEILAPVVGYVGRISPDELKAFGKMGYRAEDRIGKSGVEAFYESILRGKEGYRRIEVDALGNVVQVLDFRPPSFTHSLQLTIDGELQRACYEALGGKNGVIIVGDPKSGEILAFVSKPSFDPNPFSKGITAQEWLRLVRGASNPLLVRPTQALYPPGSLFKILVALAAQEEKVVASREVFFCPGYFEYGGRRYFCWRKEGHGRVSFEEAIAQSCNVVFYTLGLRLGPERIARYAKMFGFGEHPNLDLPGVRTGLFPTPEWKQDALKEIWYPGDTMNLSIGQGYLLVTPFEMYLLFCAVANRGKIYDPHVLSRVVDTEGRIVREIKPYLRRIVPLHPQTWDAVIRGMEKVVTQGTGWHCRGLPVRLAAKTGTAQNPQGREHSWFGGFFPSENPRFVFLVLVEHGGDGSGEAAQVARRIIEWLLRERGV